MSDEVNRNGKSASFVAPYASFKTFQNLVERMASEGGGPNRIDRSYLANLPGSTQTMLLATLRSLGLIDDAARPTPLLLRAVRDEVARPEVIREVVVGHYGEAVALTSNATQQELEEVFRKDYGVSGSTLRKAVAFYLSAAKYAGIAVSPHFRTPKASSNSAARSRKRPSNQRSDGPEHPQPQQASAKDRYIDLLLRKAEEDGSDTGILDRIEKVLGLQSSEASARESAFGSDPRKRGETDS